MKSYIALFFFLFIGITVKAQTAIKGKILDSNTGQGVEYATIAVIDLASGKTLDGTTADSSGHFAVQGLDLGRYALLVSFLGYDEYRSDTVFLKTKSQQVELPPVMLKTTANTLSDVTITARTPIVENKIDKIVYNASNDVTAQGGAAIDVLKKVPQVSVDIDGNVELQGNPNIRFLINGKPSSIFGSSLTDALASIPASQIKSIEVITSPGARYDAQGTGGIINIILKENKAKGINGSVNLSAGTRMENTSVNLNARNGNFGMNAFFSGNATLQAKSYTSQDRTTYNLTDQTTTRLLQDGYNNVKRSGYETGLGFDWDLSSRDAVTASFQYNYFTSNQEGIIQITDTTRDSNGNYQSGAASQRYATSRNNMASVDLGFNYKHKFRREGEVLDIDYNSSFGKPVTQYNQQQIYSDEILPYSGLSSNNPGRDNQHNISLNYVRPVNKNIVLETGAKAIFNNISSITDVNSLSALTGEYIADPLQSYSLHYKMNVYAGYAAASFSLFHFLDVKAGLRVEHTDAAIDFNNTQIPSYNTYVPSAILSHKWRDNQFIKLAYAHRIERPEYKELNPFLNLSDPYNISTGNPLLQPEIGDNFELAYSRSFENGGNVYVSLIERINSNDIKPFTTFYPSFTVGDSVYNNVSITTRRNIGTEYNSGLIVSGSLPVIPHVDVRGNFMLFNRYIVNSLNGANAITSSFNWRLNLNIDYQLPHNLIAELFGNYKSPFNNIQGRNPQFLTYTIAFRKQFWDNKASLGLTASNIFSNSIRQVTTVHTDAYVSYDIRDIPMRSVGITFSYRFGHLDYNKNNKDRNSYRDVGSEN